MATPVVEFRNVGGLAAGNPVARTRASIQRCRSASSPVSRQRRSSDRRSLSLTHLP